jgi:pimeloyl-ACP methyl ester carboxylesterase
MDQPQSSEQTVKLPPLGLEGMLAFPQRAASGLIIFAHGSGSSRFSPRNNFVARELRKAGFATLLFDLLNKDEESDRRNVFDIELLSRRLEAATLWAQESGEQRGLPLGYFGASTGAAAALVAGARLGSCIGAIVSRGGRPDLAGDSLAAVKAPTLLIVGGFDSEVLALNQEAQRTLHCPTALNVVPGATHLFEEPGALEQVVDLATNWFRTHLPVQANA